MGRRKLPQGKKKPADFRKYGTISFRPTKATQRRLEALIEEIQKARNSGRDKIKTPFTYKADLYVEALEAGLKVLRKKV